MLSRDEALNLVRQYKQVIMPRFNGQAEVLMFGSYSKGYANQWSDIDVAVIVPTVADDKWLETSVALGKDGDKVSLLIKPVLMAEDRWSPLYDDVMQEDKIMKKTFSNFRTLAALLYSKTGELVLP